MTSPRESALDELERAGFPVAAFTDRERTVFAGLSRAELDLILDIKARLDDDDPAGAEVQAHGGPVAGAALF